MTTTIDRTQIRTRVYLVLSIRRVALSHASERLIYRGRHLDLTADQNSLSVRFVDDSEGTITAPTQTAQEHGGSLALALDVEQAIDDQGGSR